MADSETAGAALLNFIEEARYHASGVNFQMRVGLPPSPKPSLVQLCEKYASKLTDDERDELLRMVDKMSRAFPPPPTGAIVPPP